VTPTTRVRPAFRWLLAAFLVALIPYVAWSIWDYHEASRLGGLVRRAHGVLPPAAAAGPLDPAAATATIDAIRLYFAAASLVSGGVHLPSIDAAPDGSPAPELAARIRETLANFDTVFQLLAQARALPAQPWSVEMLGPWPVNLYPLATVLSFRTRAFARLGDINAAAQSLLDEADLLRVEAAHRPASAPMPFGISASWIQAQVGSDLGQVLQRGSLPQGALDRLADALRADAPDDLHPMLTWQIQQILRYPSNGDWPQKTDGLAQLLAQRAALPAEHARVSELLQDRLDALDAVGGQDVEWSARLQRAKQAAAQAPPRNLSMLRSIDGIATNSAAKVASARIARVAIAIERYRQRHGQMPARLADLTPDELDAVPMDPFDGQPLRYRTGDGFVMIYSVGRNGADDGGKIARTVPPYAITADVGTSPDVGLRFPIR
jgi:hypothetical protein